MLPGILLASTLILLVLFLLERRKNQQLIKKQQGEVIEKAQEKSYELLHQAIAHSQNVYSEIEKEEGEILQKSLQDSTALQQEFENKFNNELVSFKNSIDASQVEYQKYLEDLKRRTEEAQIRNQDFIRAQIDQVFENFEQKLSDFLLETEQRSVTSIDLELKAARQLIETYKTQQLKLIDENIVAMLEKTLSLVLSKKLTLKDNVDLIYEALEKAKVEKFIV